MKRDLLVFVSGFGNPYFTEKTNILRNNVRSILRGVAEGVWSKVDFKVALYENEIDIPDEIKCVPNLEVIRGPGFVSCFIKRIVTPELVQAYDYVLLILDDVEVTNVNWKKVLTLKEITNSHVVSPSLTLDSAFQYQYMLTCPDATHTAKVTSCCEYFSFLVDRVSYVHKFYQFLDEENPSGWGIDLILFADKGVRTVIVNKEWTVKHYIKGQSYKDVCKDPYGDFVKYITKRGHTHEDLTKQLLVLCFVHMNHVPETTWEQLWHSFFSA